MTIRYFQVNIARMLVWFCSGLFASLSPVWGQSAAESSCLKQAGGCASPVVFVDGQPVAGLCGLQPDSVFWAQISPAGDTVSLLTQLGVQRNGSWQRWPQVLKQRRVKHYYVDWEPVDKKAFADLPIDGVKSAEYDSVSRSVVVFTRERKGFVIARNGVMDAFLYRPSGASSVQDASDSLAYRLASAASFVPATFRGGNIDTFSRWVASQVIYPSSLQRFSRSGAVYMRFEVRSDGTIGAFKSMEPVNPLFVEEVLRVLKTSPQWTPATVFGRPVASSYVIPIAFNIKDSLVSGTVGLIYYKPGIAVQGPVAR